MSRKINKKRAASRPMTFAEAAALDFEPWPADAKSKPLLTVAEWNKALITILFAWRVMSRSKAQLVEAIAKCDDPFAELIEPFGGVSNMLKGVSALVEAAEMRLLSAAAAYETARIGRG